MAHDSDLAKLEAFAARKHESDGDDAVTAAVVSGYAQIIAARIIANAIRESGLTILGGAPADLGE